MRRDPLFHFVLLNPEIPNNTGNIGRTAAALGCRLHIVHPIGFSMDDKARRRAGLDYWHLVDCVEHLSWGEFLAHERPRRMWLFTSHGEPSLYSAKFERGDYLLFGSETRGAPDHVHEWVSERFGEHCRVCLPMRPEARSLNLAVSVGVAVYEAQRQLATLLQQQAGVCPCPYSTVA